MLPFVPSQQVPKPLGRWIRNTTRVLPLTISGFLLRQPAHWPPASRLHLFPPLLFLRVLLLETNLLKGFQKIKFKLSRGAHNALEHLNIMLTWRPFSHQPSRAQCASPTELHFRPWP